MLGEKIVFFWEVGGVWGGGGGARVIFPVIAAPARLHWVPPRNTSFKRVASPQLPLGNWHSQMQIYAFGPGLHIRNQPRGCRRRGTAPVRLGPATSLSVPVCAGGAACPAIPSAAAAGLSQPLGPLGQGVPRFIGAPPSAAEVWVAMVEVAGAVAVVVMRMGLMGGTLEGHAAAGAGAASMGAATFRAFLDFRALRLGASAPLRGEGVAGSGAGVAGPCGRRHKRAEGGSGVFLTTGGGGGGG